MRADSGATPQVSEAKEDAITAVYGDVPYEVLNERMIILDGRHTLVVDDIERLHLEEDVFFSSLPQIGDDLLSEYIPKDLDASIMMKYVNLVIEDSEVDDYTTCRFIQQLIDWDRYLHDMMESVEPEYSAVSSAKVISKSMPVDLPPSLLPDLVASESYPVVIDLSGNQVAVSLDEQGNPTRTFHFIRMDVDPLSELQRKCTEWGISGLFVTKQDSDILLKGVSTGIEYKIGLFPLGANSLDELMAEIGDQVRIVQLEGANSHTVIVTNGIKHDLPDEDVEPEFEFTTQIGILSTKEKVAPVQTKEIVTH